MEESFLLVDSHAHIFSSIDGYKKGKLAQGLRYGRIKTAEGTDPFFPALLEDIRFPIDMLVEIMDRHGVEKAVLLQNPYIGIHNEEIAAAIHRYPDRFVGTIQVDPLKESAVDTINAFGHGAQSVLKFELSENTGWLGLHPQFKLDAPYMSGIWEAVADLHLQVILDLGPIDGPGYQIDALDGIMARLDNTTFILEHLGLPERGFADKPQSVKRRNRCLALAKKPKVYLGMAAVANLMGDEYPCPAMLSLLRQAVDLVGADKILWGSDIPSTLKDFTYRQMLDAVIKHAPFLSETEIRKIMGLNATRVFPSFAL